jgi:uncharacterized cupredoxin-like copper-binding protein
VSDPTLTDDEKLPPLGGAGLSTALIVFAVVAVLCLTFAISVVSLGDEDSAASTGLGAPLTAHVGLSEFSIDPSPVEVAEGGTLHVQNDGAAVHNLAIVDTELKTPDLDAAAVSELDVSSLATGSYQMVCLIPGHEAAGMTADLEVVAGSSSGSATPTVPTGQDGHGGMDFAKMTEDMLATMAAFPAATEGVGNVPLAPTEIAADGTKVFDLDMRVVDWEVEPGKVVQAWSFNGMVPGPRIDLEVGDKVDIRLKNSLEIATDLHLHGLNVENGFDGVAPITQDLIEPDESLTYSFVADEVAVAMYHPHAHGHMLLPDGMFGVILVGDVNLHRGQTISGHAIPADVQVSQEIPMVLNDAGVIGFSLNGKSFPATAPIAAQTGEWILVHYFNEGTQIHPMHLHQFDQIVIAKDGFDLDQPFVADTLNVAPGERYSVLIRLDKPGTWVWHCHILPHVEREAGMFGMVTAVVVS